MPYVTLQRYLSGDRKPNVDALIKISQFIDVNMNWLLMGEGPMYRHQLEEKKAEYKKRDKVDQKKDWLSDWWAQADDKKRHWLEIEMGRTFPEYREWLEKQGL
ncbi:MAG: helix-turn-helix transcriptional regulator [Pseudomonadota bacterium]